MHYRRQLLFLDGEATAEQQVEHTTERIKTLATSDRMMLMQSAMSSLSQSVRSLMASHVALPSRVLCCDPA